MIYINVKGNIEILPHNKKTRQGNSINSKLSATSRNGKRKKYRGQGKR